MTDYNAGYILALETAVGGGSVALLLGDRIVSERVIGSAARAEDILKVTASVAMAAGEIGMIAVSRGPGSFTGIRVGLAFAKGLAAATGADLRTVPLLPAIARAGGREGHPALACVRTGKDECCLQRFSEGGGPAGPPFLSSGRELAATLADAVAGETVAVLEEGAAEIASGVGFIADSRATRVIGTEEMAAAVGRFARRCRTPDDGTPIYLNSRFRLPENTVL